MNVDCVSSYLLVSRNSGLIEKMSIFLTRQQYQYVCMFVYNDFYFIYIHLLKCQTGDEVVERNEYSEAYYKSYGVDIKHYYSYKRISWSARWMNQYRDINQVFTFSVFNSHHQNSQAECHIRLLQDLARCHIIHAHHQCPSAIKAKSLGTT